MIGFPKTLNTKQDYLTCIDLFPVDTKVELQRLLDDRFVWKNKGVIAIGDTPVKDGTHKVQKSVDGTEIHQLELIDDDCAKIYRLGFSVEEVENLIKGDQDGK